MLVTVREAAMALQISPGFLRRLVRTGRLPAYRLSPRTTRVDLEEVRRLAMLPTDQHRPEALQDRAGVEVGMTAVR